MALMAGRSNAATELVRLWLEARHGCLLTESVPVAVPYSQSDLDLVAVQATLSPFALPSGLAIGPRVVVECKDHHDWEPTADAGLWPRTAGKRTALLRGEHEVIEHRGPPVVEEMNTAARISNQRMPREAHAPC